MDPFDGVVKAEDCPHYIPATWAATGQRTCPWCKIRPVVPIGDRRGRSRRVDVAETVWPQELEDAA